MNRPINPKKLFNIFVRLTEDDDANVEEAEARKMAAEVAALLGSKILPTTQQLAINEPYCPFKIPMDSEQFQSSIRISESLYTVVIKHRRGEKAIREDALFCVSFKNKDRVMFTEDRVNGVSKELGVPVYRQGFIEDEVVAKHLLANGVRNCVGTIDFKPLTRFFLSPVQLEVTSMLASPSVAAAQVWRFQELMAALSLARKPGGAKQAGK